MRSRSMRGADLIWQTGVVRSRDGRAWLEFDDPGACSRCESGKGCGAALFSRLFSQPAAVIPLGDADNPPVGRRVRAGLNPRWLMRAAAAFYLLPVAAFLAGCLGAHAIWPDNDLAALSGGTLVAALVIRVARERLRRAGPPGLELIEIDSGLESRGIGGHLPSHET